VVIVVRIAEHLSEFTGKVYSVSLIATNRVSVIKEIFIAEAAIKRHLLFGFASDAFHYFSCQWCRKPEIRLRSWATV